MKKWIIIAVAALLVLIVVVNLVSRGGGKSVEVEIVDSGIRELVATVSASGTLTPKRKVDVSAETIGRITSLAVAEGDEVEEGDFLLEIDPAEYQSQVRGFAAAVRTSAANLDLSEATAEKAGLDLRRATELYESGLATQQDQETAETDFRIAGSRVDAARATLRQAEATLEKARHDLAKVTIRAPMAGLITRLNVEEGENAIMGTLNNPGTVLLTIADLSTMEAEINVDETEVVDIVLGQPAGIEIDAFPDTTFTGEVTEIGNSPIYTSTGQSQQAVDFKVTITLLDQVPGVRPGLSAQADITVARRDSALAVPIGAVVVREWPPRENSRRGRGRGRAATDTTDVEREDREGVFVVEDGKARFTPVELGITGEEDFEVLSGLEADQPMVAGPFRVLRDLQHGDRVKEQKTKRGRE